MSALKDVSLTEAEGDTLVAVAEELSALMTRLDPGLAAAACCAELMVQMTAVCDGDLRAARARATALMDYTIGALSGADEPLPALVN